MQANFAQLAQDADAGQIAETAVSTWRRIEAALSPIIGQQAVAALYKRSLALIGPDYPWLAPREGDQDDEFVELRIRLSQQTSSTAMAAHRALLQTFLDILTGLLGESLTQRLLSSVCDTSSTADTAPGTTS